MKHIRQYRALNVLKLAVGIFTVLLVPIFDHMRAVLLALQESGFQTDEISRTQALCIGHLVAADHVSSCCLLLAQTVLIDCKTSKDEFVNSFGISGREVCHNQRTGVLSDNACLLNAESIHEIDNAVGKVGELKPLGSCGREAEAEGIRGINSVLLCDHGDNALVLKVVPPALVNENYRITVTHSFIVHLSAGTLEFGIAAFDLTKIGCHNKPP